MSESNKTITKKLSRVKYKEKVYKHKGYKINVLSSFKSSQEIISQLINNKTDIAGEVNHIDPKDIDFKPTQINKYDKAKLLARKYKHLDPVLKRMSKMKIRTDAQVDFINKIISFKTRPKS